MLLIVTQGSLLERLLFDIYVKDLFYLTEISDVCNYAEDVTFLVCELDIKSLIIRLEHDAFLALEWFESKYMKLNQEKCNFLFSGPEYEKFFANKGEAKIWENKH